MLQILSSGRVIIAPNIPVSSYILDGRDDELMELVIAAKETDPTISICGPDDFLPGFKQGLEKDAHLLTQLLEEWKALNRDPKLDEFLERLKTELLSKELNPGKKMVVFSEAKDTTNYLTEALLRHGYTRVLTVDSTNRKERMPIVRANFDANIPLSEQANDFDIIISTEVLAEGTNLHRASLIVNYDTPWNSTRLMQRIGRVNRIGTTADRIYIFNFYPTARVDTHIDLKKKAILKLQAFHSALGEDSQIYSPDEEVDNFGLFDKEVEEERDERLQWLNELRKFRLAFPNEYRRIKNLPLRARVGRQKSTMDGATLVFFRNRRRDAFYRLSDKVEEISFVEMAREFKSTVEEKAIPLHPNHHDQVNQAVEHFNQQILSEATEQRVIDTTQSPHERRVIRFLDEILTIPSVSESEKSMLRAAKVAIRKVQFQKLQRDLAKLDKAVKAHKSRVVAAALIDQVVRILSKYPLYTATDDSPRHQTAVTPSELAPDIILSESFSV